ncbi:DNA modification methylase [Defluviimonas aestuarii]|uniref:DNA modification methylase n=1 Tax=Albidovulum aestuarii TaxID=1130726 RepID=UPI00249A3C41|nr:DNA modification methylase [Defluviimonas aestuarii]MDI3337932.1 DNA modification methylase [Defluviimonas aestuarii]
MTEHPNTDPAIPDPPGTDLNDAAAENVLASTCVQLETSAAHGKNDLFAEVTLVWLLVKLIDQAPRRVRRAVKSQTEAVMRSIETFGFRIPILVRSKPGGERYEVVDGHTRLAAALRLGAEKLPCILVDDLPDVEIRRLALSLNKLQETAEWDNEALRLEINEIIEIGGVLEIPGFVLPELEAIRFGAGDAEEPDPADDLSGLVKPDTPVVSRAGDVWGLGDHRILCGSARDTTAIAALLDGQVVDAVFSDAPYNLKVNGFLRSAAAGFAEFAEASGEMSRPDFVRFLIETLGNAAAVLKPGGVLFACMDWRHVGEMTEALDALGLDLLNICVWVKTNPGMGSLYRSQHELVFVARRSGAGHQNNVQLGKFGRNRSNVWTYAGATGGQTDADDDFHAHPTVKPIRLVMDALLDVTEPGHLVVDPFLGSGTTLLAAERTRRRCSGVEIEPRYVDLAIRRWQAMTGGQAIHAESGATFDGLAAEGGQNDCDDKEGF